MREYHGDFEVHLTGWAPESNSFAIWCEHHFLKCVRIILDRGTSADQPMATYRRSKSTLSKVLEEAQRFAQDATLEGFSILRIKIEASPFNPDLPQYDADTVEHPPDNYFEHHVKLIREPNAAKAELLTVCEKYNAHLSRNAFRDLGEHEERFVTLRSYGVGRETSFALLHQMLADLKAIGEIIAEHESEYCVYDSNLALDSGWLPNDPVLTTI